MYIHKRTYIFKLNYESNPAGGGVPQYYLCKFKKAYKVVITSVLKTSMLPWSFSATKNEIRWTTLARQGRPRSISKELEHQTAASVNPLL